MLTFNVISICVILSLMGTGSAEFTYVIRPRESQATARASSSLIDTSFLSWFRHRRSTTDVIKPTVTSLKVTSNIQSRFANTTVTTIMQNDLSVDIETSVYVQFPESAFITDFSMVIDGVLYIGVVKEKSEAEKDYNDAKERNETAGIVSSVQSPNLEPGMELFAITVNFKQNTSAQFDLTYQQLLERQLGWYEQKINIQPGQIVNDLEVRVNIQEDQGLAQVKTSTPVGAAETITGSSSRSQTVVYRPTTSQQQSIVSKGINLIVSYDIIHTVDGSYLEIENDYFVHYFSPSGLTIMNKMILFIIDISGSMSGTKMKQTRDAMQIILGQLRSQDYFGILIFDDKIKSWRSEMLLANPENVAQARQFCNVNLVAGGSTNIYDALITGVDMVARSMSSGNIPIIIFMTDGQPTAGPITQTPSITEHVTVKNLNKKISIYSLGFGYNLDLDFLKILSWKNYGYAKRIYENIDMNLQLQNFYDTISSPLLSNVQVVYPNEVLISTDVTDTKFPHYFKGSELVISGRLQAVRPISWIVKVVGDSINGKVELKKEVDYQNSGAPSGFAERLWAYKRIKQLLKDELLAKAAGETSKQNSLRAEALKLSLEYNFVTPLTSMVVTQANFDNANFRRVPLRDTSVRNVMFANLGGIGSAEQHKLSLLLITLMVTNTVSFF